MVNHNKFRKKGACLQINKSKGNQSKLTRRMKRRMMMKKKASTERKFKRKELRKKRELPSSNIKRTWTSIWKRIH